VLASLLYWYTIKPWKFNKQIHSIYLELCIMPLIINYLMEHQSLKACQLIIIIIKLVHGHWKSYVIKVFFNKTVYIQVPNCYLGNSGHFSVYCSAKDYYGCCHLSTCVYEGVLK
jgi:hypothetical protein